ncbi:hypothetical protein KSD_86160 [Ktedonobacter sp. SOSP1-85]|uniref:GvpL/GvpF family gas vesicle protein n=1 Tax=Ktedonobacter sp. SOSP1-85 TaxID=2778367 RepID=UPI001915ADB5|nr:GvpL/GvpF family gas vesicle protein [Ktedonobacter sp. SOSP1-85]GHO80845.1 hypothetical protein KSD_86160 [Ktedonobacter sp. SOSP1-85]
MQNGIYIYCIIKTSEHQEFGAIGIGDATASNVLTIGFKDIAAVISHNPLVVYDSLSKEKVIKDLFTHERVIEKIMGRFTTVPVKFGTMVETEDRVIEFLENGYTLLRNELDKVEGKIEQDVVATWEQPAVLAILARQNEQFREMQQKIASEGEQASIEDKVLLGQLIDQALKTEKNKYQQLILQDLKQESVDICPYDMINDDMIFNAAFLLEKKNQEAFDNAIHSLDQKLENTVYFREVGPLPPYSFSTILFKRIDPEEVEEAKNTLGLTGEITEEALRDAYYQLAKKYHPDKTSGDTSQEFQVIQNAHRTLRNFIEGGLIHTQVYRWKEDVQWDS